MTEFLTYAQCVLSQLDSVARLVRKYSLTSAQKRKQFSEREGRTALNLRQIKDALANPQNPIEDSVHAFAFAIQLRRGVADELAQIEYQRIKMTSMASQLRNKYPELTELSQKKLCAESIRDLEQTVRNLSIHSRKLSEIQARIKKIEDRIAELSTQFDIKWGEFRAEHLSALATQLEASNIPLSELEKQELADQETWPELLKRFETTGLSLPPKFDIEKTDMTTYFVLKTYLAVHASLGRRMLPNTIEEIKKL